MKARTLIELLTLSTNLYMISKDENFLDHLGEMAEKGKKKLSSLAEEFAGDDDAGEDRLVEKMILKAKQAKEELEQKMEEVAVKAYRKLHIAHTDDLKNVLERIELLEKKLSIVEARVGA